MIPAVFKLCISLPQQWHIHADCCLSFLQIPLRYPGVYSSLPETQLALSSWDEFDGTEQPGQTASSLKQLLRTIVDLKYLGNGFKPLFAS